MSVNCIAFAVESLCYLVKCLYLGMEVVIKVTDVSVASLAESSVLS